ncbi:hypothetical protein P3T18_004855 [Paraburkholderia sp. GAS199]
MARTLLWALLLLMTGCATSVAQNPSSTSSSSAQPDPGHVEVPHRNPKMDGPPGSN